MRLHRPLLALTLVLAVLLSVVSTMAQQPLTPLEEKPEVPYVPTHEKVVAEMLKVAQVGENDILYDLGSGDGRIVITAAKEFGARGVGVDIDPARIREARENAVKAGVADKVKFLQQDLFETDIREATVVTLYLLPEVNRRLRPKLLSDLEPGTRVVSHNHDMGDSDAAQDAEGPRASGHDVEDAKRAPASGAHDLLLGGAAAHQPLSSVTGRWSHRASRGVWRWSTPGPPKERHLSETRSSLEDAPRGMEFLYTLNRLNGRVGKTE